ncbi:MAG: hypothetical protein V3T72_22425 [Thermoanaerobaculia bacterium]
MDFIVHYFDILAEQSESANFLKSFSELDAQRVSDKQRLYPAVRCALRKATRDDVFFKLLTECDSKGFSREDLLASEDLVERLEKFLRSGSGTYLEQHPDWRESIESALARLRPVVRPKSVTAATARRDPETPGTADVPPAATPDAEAVDGERGERPRAAKRRPPRPAPDPDAFDLRDPGLLQRLIEIHDVAGIASKLAGLIEANLPDPEERDHRKWFEALYWGFWHLYLDQKHGNKLSRGAPHLRIRAAGFLEKIPSPVTRLRVRWMLRTAFKDKRPIVEDWRIRKAWLRPWGVFEWPPGA